MPESTITRMNRKEQPHVNARMDSTANWRVVTAWKTFLLHQRNAAPA
jgi:hypothetical protein